jgi:hypothetical protein
MTIPRILTILALSILPVSTFADGNYSLGLGYGILYNGIGFNIAATKRNEIKYATIGCLGVSYSQSDDFNGNCGIGFGLVNTDILSNSNRHGLGIHIGTTYNTTLDDDKYEPFAGISYTYFTDGIDREGFTLGVAPIIGRHNEENDAAILLNIGYQFKF